MKVRFLQSISGPTWNARPKEIREVSNAEALRFFNADPPIAVPVDEVLVTVDVTDHSGAGPRALKLEETENQAPGADPVVVKEDDKEVAIMPPAETAAEKRKRERREAKLGKPKS